MTFEEFFIKKKIDLKALQAADKPLFEEFKAHYSAMGEKSFDHSKKFWFNKLRKSFHLKEEETPAAKPAVKQAVADTPTETSGSKAIKPAGFKPRFKATITPAVDEAKTTEAPDSTKTETASAPTGFKPRFKAGVTKAPDTAATTPASEETTDKVTPSAPKPTGFKPRFKAGVTKAPDSAASTPVSEETTDETTSSAPKPTGFKPRFKAGVTKIETSEKAPQAAPKAEVKSEETVNAEQKIDDSDTQQTPAIAPENRSTDEQQTATSKPTGFKPRFKAGVTKIETSEQAPQAAPKAEVKSEETVNAEQKIDDSDTQQTPAIAPENHSIDEQQTATSKPTGFKPRFKAGLTKIDKKEE